MTPTTNRQWILASRPTGLPALENFRLTESAVPPLKAGEVLLQTVFLSVDPYMRPRMRAVRSYVAPLEVGEVLEGGVAGRVIDSKHPAFKAGDFATARLGWQDYAVV